MMSSPWLVLAGALCLGLAAIHSLLGERMIFRGRSATAIPKRYFGIIRASWHALSLFGAALGIILWRVPMDDVSAIVLVVALTVSAAMIAIWTRFRHPGWIVIGLIAALVLISRL